MKHRLTHLDLSPILIASGGWTMLVLNAPERRRAKRLTELGLARRPAEDPTFSNGLTFALKLTPLGNALGCLLARRRGSKLRRAGVQLLARYRQRLVERFEIERGLRDLPMGHLGVAVGPVVVARKGGGRG
jgi:hypothetical protein